MTQDGPPQDGLPEGSSTLAGDLMQVYESMTGAAGVDNSKQQGPSAAEISAPSSYPTAPPVPAYPPPPEANSDQFLLSATTGAPANLPLAPAAPFDYAPLAAEDAKAAIPTSYPENQTPASAPSSSRPKRPKRKSATTSSSNASQSSDKDEGGRGGSSKKKSKSDSRWSKRFTWPEDLHRDFVSAIFDVGLKHSSPSSILEHMPQHEQITSERVKSHLQKYRLHRLKSKKEFMGSYESSLRKLNAEGVENLTSLAGGEMAAHLAYASLQGEGGSNKGNTTSNGNATSNNVKFERLQDGTNCLLLPQLTEAEKASPMGSALGYLMGLFFSLKQQLMIQRANAPDQAAQQQQYQNQPPATPFPVASIQGVATAPNTSAPSNHHHHHHQPIPLQIGGAGMDSSAAWGLATAAAVGPASAALPQLNNNEGLASGRTQLEESNAMKREMRNQMAFQNKMRALKQQEQHKFKAAAQEMPMGDDEHHQHHHLQPPPEHHESFQDNGEPTESDQGGNAYLMGDPGKQHRARGISLGNHDDFWSSDVVDDQLFEFLMDGS